MYNRCMSSETYKPELRESSIPPIEQKSIDSVLLSLKEAFGIELDAEGVEVSINYPGDETFSRIEENYRKEIGAEGDLTGELPGFVAVIAEKHMAFFAIKPEKIVEMANRYAEKEGLEDRFINGEDAQQFIEGLSIKALIHEITHIAWPEKIDPVLMQKWKKLVQQNKPLQERVIHLQKDKYGNVENIPVEEEALADAMVEILTFGKLRSRLDMPEVISSLRKLINEKDVDTGLVNRSSISPQQLDPTRVTFNEYGEIEYEN